jgi:hypothetical protein
VVAGNCIFHATSARCIPSIPVPIRNSENVLTTSNGTSYGEAADNIPIQNNKPPECLTTKNSVCREEVISPVSKGAKSVVAEKERIQEVAPLASNGKDSLTNQVFTPHLVEDYSEKLYQIALEPFAYILSLPEKGARHTLIDALDNYYEIPAAPLLKIRKIVAAIHNVSLMYELFSNPRL